MSVVAKESIEVIAQSIGINNLSPDVALALAPDVEYRLREIMQEAIKCMCHSRRTRLTVNDVDSALDLRNVEPVYGFTSGGQLRFKRAIGHRDLFYIDDKDVNFKDVIESPLPKAPLDTAVCCHWLAIEGVQPAIPENASVEVIAALSDVKKNDQKNDVPIDIKLPVQHVLTRELQLYFENITELVVSKSDSVLFKEALASLASDSGLHQLVPYFTRFIADEVSHGLSDYRLLFALMRVVSSLLQNPHVHVEPYLHQLMPSVVTCLVAKKLGNRFVENHWELRDFTANLVASICKRFGHTYNTLQTRLTKTLLNAFLDPKRAMTQHYGAIQGLTALGPNVVQLLVLPNLKPYMQLLEPEMLLASQKNGMKRYEAWRVYGALLHASGHCLYDRLKVFPPLQSHSPHSALRVNTRVATTLPNKRKADMDSMESQQPLKKMEIDVPNSVPSSNSSPSQLHKETANAGSPSSSQRPNESVSDTTASRRNNGNGRHVKTPTALAHIWKDDLNSGQVLISLFDLFGESILSYIPAPELSMFL